MLSCVISGCEPQRSAVPAALLSSSKARRAGARLFAEHCAICHGAQGNGEGLRGNGMMPPPANLTMPPWAQRRHAARTFLAIRNGVGQTAMAPWPTLSERQTWQLVAYIESLGEGSSAGGRRQCTNCRSVRR